MLKQRYQTPPEPPRLLFRLRDITKNTGSLLHWRWWSLCAAGDSENLINRKLCLTEVFRFKPNTISSNHRNKQPNDQQQPMTGSPINNQNRTIIRHHTESLLFDWTFVGHSPSDARASTGHRVPREWTKCEPADKEYYCDKKGRQINTNGNNSLPSGSSSYGTGLSRTMWPVRTLPLPSTE